MYCPTDDMLFMQQTHTVHCATLYLYVSMDIYIHTRTVDCANEISLGGNTTINCHKYISLLANAIYMYI